MRIRGCLGRATLLAAGGVVALVTAAWLWAAYRTSDDRLPAGAYEPRAEPHWEVAAEKAREIRDDALARARVWREPAEPIERVDFTRNPGESDPLDPTQPIACKFLPAATQRDHAEVRLHPARRRGRQGEVRRHRGDPRGGGGVAAPGRAGVRRRSHVLRAARPLLRLPVLALPRLPGARARPHGRRLHAADRLRPLPGLRMAGGGAALRGRLHRHARRQGMGLLRAGQDRSRPRRVQPGARRCPAARWPSSSTTGTTRPRTSGWCAWPRPRARPQRPLPEAVRLPAGPGLDLRAEQGELRKLEHAAACGATPPRARSA